MLQEISPAPAEPVGRAVPDADDAAGLRELMRQALRSALHGAARSDGMGGDLDDQSRRLLSQACAHARTSGIRAERFIVIVKAAWFELPEARRARRDTAEATLARVITRCIDEYYAEYRPPQRAD